MGYPNEYGEEQFVVEQSVGWMGINSASVQKEEAFDYTDEERDEIRHIVDNLVLYSFSSGIIGEIIQSRVSIYMAE